MSTILMSKLGKGTELTVGNQRVWTESELIATQEMAVSSTSQHSTSKSINSLGTQRLLPSKNSVITKDMFTFQLANQNTED